jgi:hypothetical protein
MKMYNDPELNPAVYNQKVAGKEEVAESHKVAG